MTTSLIHPPVLLPVPDQKQDMANTSSRFPPSHPLHTLLCHEEVARCRLQLRVKIEIFPRWLTPPQTPSPGCHPR